MYVIFFRCKALDVSNRDPVREEWIRHRAAQLHYDPHQQGKQPITHPNLQPWWMSLMGIYPSASQTLSALPDQDSFYDMTDCLEQLGMEGIVQKHMTSCGTEGDLKQQFIIYEVISQYTSNTPCLRHIDNCSKVWGPYYFNFNKEMNTVIQQGHIKAAVH